jgi:hypothetical protein
MAGKDTNEIVVGANGSVYVAPVGTTGPTKISDPLDSAFIDLGYVSEDGVTFLDGKTVEPINVWQLFYPARRVVTEKEASAAFVLRQWGDDQVVFAFGGGVITIDAAGEYRFTPPDPGIIDERAMAIEWVDGSKDYRLIIPRGMVTENIETNLTKTAASDLPITFGINGESGVAPWYLQTNDPAFQPPLG